jgi:hypothetical protein
MSGGTGSSYKKYTFYIVEVIHFENFVHLVRHNVIGRLCNCAIYRTYI